MDRHPEEKVGHPSLPPEGREKRPFFEERLYPRCDPAPDVNAARGQRLQGQIPRLCSEDGAKKCYRTHTEAGLIRKRRLDDDRHGIDGLRQPRSEPGRFFRRSSAT